jgi:photosystem II stability/assembly factor-like uncharacterized protein
MPFGAGFGAHTYVSGRESQALVVQRNSLEPEIDDLDPIRSFDGGATWTPFRVLGGVPTSMVFSPSDARTWYARMGDGHYRTRDGGDTWTALAMDLPSGHDASGISLHEVGAGPLELYALSFERHYLGSSVVGALISGDGGDTWREFDLGRDPLRLRRLVPSASDPGVVHAIYEDALQRTADGGATWTVVTPPGWEGSRTVNSFAIDRRDSSIVYCVPTRIHFNDPPPPLWVTRDGGSTWASIALPESDIVADPLERGRAYAFEQFRGLPGLPRMRVRETRDAGRSWVTVESGISDPRVPQAGQILAEGMRRTVVAASAYGLLWSLRLDHGALALGSDLWWDPAQPGKGLTITQHASTNPFVVWYDYDSTGSAVWRVIPGGTWNNRTFTGTMYETTGPPYFSAAFDPSRVSMRGVGTATLRFEDEDNAVFAHSIGGASGETPITRQLFAAPVPSTTESYADLWWNASESGWGIAINHQHNRIFATWYVYGDDGKPLWVAMPDAVIGQEFVGAIVRPVATGDIYTTRGPAAGTPFDPVQVVPTRIGTATLHFSSAGQATLEYTAFGRTESRSITRQPF